METHADHADKILTPESWDWDTWLPFWTEDDTEDYVFVQHYKELFGRDANPIKEAVEDWAILRAWAIMNGHELGLVSAHRPHCIAPTEACFQPWGFVGFGVWWVFVVLGVGVGVGWLGVVLVVFV